MKKIFILTGEPSGDKLASKVISRLTKKRSDIEYLSVGGENLKALNIKSIYDLNEITYLGFTRVLLNIFKIKKKIKETAKEILKFKPDVLFSVDSPDFTLRVVKEVKKNNPNIKAVHFVAPQVWVWRENRVKELKLFLDHILLLFSFEKVFFDKEQVSSEFVGHPLLEETEEAKIDVNQILSKNKAIISVFPGSRTSEIKVLMPILIKFIKLMNQKYNDFIYVFHSTKEHNNSLRKYIVSSGLKNCEIISDEKIKNHLLRKSVFAVSKSGTVSLEICNAKIPLIIIYKVGFINFLIVKSLVKTKFANILNYAANEEIIPELLQSKCSAENIYKHVEEFLDDPDKIRGQIKKIQIILNKFKTDKSASELASLSLNKFLS